MADGPRLITLFTDAGFCSRTKIGTWAAWAKVDGVAHRRSGVFRNRPDQSDMAELQAMANGLQMVMTAIDPPPGSKIIAQSDCASIATALCGGVYRKKRTRERLQHIAAHIRGTIIERRLTVEFRHVPGHAGRGTTRTSVNVTCDKECRRLLRQARAEDAAKQKEKNGT